MIGCGQPSQEVYNCARRNAGERVDKRGAGPGNRVSKLVLHNTQLCSNRLVTEAGLPAEGTAGCMSALLCLGGRGSAKSQGHPRFGAGGTMRFRIAFRSTRERRSREPGKTLFNFILLSQL